MASFRGESQFKEEGADLLTTARTARNLVIGSMLFFGDLCRAEDPKLPAGLDVAAINSLARSVVVDSIPERIDEKRGWEKQASRPGLKFKGQGAKTRLERTETLVNHGLWKQYHIEPVDPKTNLNLSIESLHALSDGGFGFDLSIQAPLKASATVEQWVWGVKILGATVDADAVATAVLTCEVRTSIEQGTLLPVVRLNPKVTASKIDLDEFKLRKLGELPRAVAKELSDEAKKIVLRYIRKNEGKIATKANASLEKKSKAGKLVFSPIPFLK